MEKILIIDECPAEAEALKSALMDEYGVTAVHTKEEGLKEAGTGEYSLILLNEAMPDMEDFGLLKEVQERVMPWHTPLLLLMLALDVQRAERALMLGAADYMVKPFCALAVQTRVHTYSTLYQDRKKEENQTMMTDYLTGVSNRQRYEINSALKWQESVRLHVPISVCIFDIDRFRTYNEHYGYRAGDKALAAIAETVSANLRRSTDFFARYRGEEFAGLILGGEGKAVFDYLTKIRQEVEELHIPYSDSPSGWVTVSIGGVTVVPEIGDSYDTYFKTAEKLASDAIHAGGNQVMWADEKMEQLREKERL